MRIGESEWHNQAFVVANQGIECSFPLVSLSDTNQMVGTVGIAETSLINMVTPWSNSKVDVIRGRR